MTFYNHIEEMVGVKYRYYKPFLRDYTTENEETETKTYGLFVSNIQKGVLTHVNPARELMWKEGLYVGCRPNEGSS